MTLSMTTNKNIQLLQLFLYKNGNNHHLFILQCFVLLSYFFIFSIVYKTVQIDLYKCLKYGFKTVSNKTWIFPTLIPVLLYLLLVCNYSFNIFKLCG